MSKAPRAGAPPGGALGFVTTMTAYRHNGRAAIHVATGRVADALASHYERLVLCAGVVDRAPETATDLCLEAPNIELVSQPPYRTTLGGLLHPFGLTRAYLRTCRRADRILIRGFPPYAFALYLLAWLWRRPVCQWAVGNPIALLRASPRRGWLRDRLGLFYARVDLLLTRLGRWLVDGSFVCNGQELGEMLRSPRTHVTASSTMTERDFFDRTDTCQGDVIRLLFVGYLRPEKGVEYLLEALPLLNLGKPWELTLVGPDEYPE